VSGKWSELKICSREGSRVLGKLNLGGKGKVGYQWATHECALVWCQFCFCISISMPERWVELENMCSWCCGYCDSQVSVKGGCEGVLG